MLPQLVRNKVPSRKDYFFDCKKNLTTDNKDSRLSFEQLLYMWYYCQFTETKSRPTVTCSDELKRNVLLELLLQYNATLMVRTNSCLFNPFANIDSKMVPIFIEKSENRNSNYSIHFRDLQCVERRASLSHYGQLLSYFKSHSTVVVQVAQTDQRRNWLMRALFSVKRKKKTSLFTVLALLTVVFGIWYFLLQTDGQTILADGEVKEMASTSRKVASGSVSHTTFQSSSSMPASLLACAICVVILLILLNIVIGFLILERKRKERRILLGCGGSKVESKCVQVASVASKAPTVLAMSGILGSRGESKLSLAW